jgi:hypothetical protein
MFCSVQPSSAALIRAAFDLFGSCFILSQITKGGVGLLSLFGTSVYNGLMLAETFFFDADQLL